MRFLKLIFSRLLIIALAILVQLVGYIYLLYTLETNFAWVSILFNVLGVIVALEIINIDEPSSYKIPWILLVVLVPLIGITLYFTFARSRLSKKVSSKFADVYDITNSALSFDKIELENLDAKGQSDYIYNTCQFNINQKSYSKYLKTGEEFFSVLKEELIKAKKYIFFEYFIIDEGKMWREIHEILIQKVNEGVDVYLMYDDIGCASKIPGNYYKKLRKEGINAIPFNKFIPIVSAIHNHRDHRKITVIDGKVAFTGGVNIADEYINEKTLFGKWKDGAVIVKGRIVDSFVALFLQNYNVMTRNKLNVDNFIVQSHDEFETEGYLQAYSSGPKPIFKENVSVGVYLNIISQAKKYLYITTPYLICDYSLIEALILAKKRGVDVKIITPHIPDKKSMFLLTRSNYKPLLEAGCEIYEYKEGFIHTKMFISDDIYATMGTVNLDYRSFIHHYECGMWIYKQNTIFDMKEDFLDIISNSSIKMDLNNSKMPFVLKIIKNLLKIFAPLF